MTRRVGVPPWTLAVAAMLSVQIRSTLSLDVVDVVGPAGAA
jgi:inner membrane transporter RhtA